MLHQVKPVATKNTTSDDDDRVYVVVPSNWRSMSAAEQAVWLDAVDV